MGCRRAVSRLVFFDVGSGAIRWGGDWHEGVDERTGSPVLSQSADGTGPGVGVAV